MNKEQALDFLRAHQPMPDTNNLDIDCEELIEEWFRVCEYFTENPHIEALPLFFGTFGGGDGYEAYPYLRYFIQKLDPDEAAPYFIEALNSSSAAIREQVSEFTLDLTSTKPEYVETLWQRVEDPNEISDVRAWCSSALEMLARTQDCDFSQSLNRIKKNIERLEECENNSRSSLQDVLENLRELLDDVS